MDQNRLCYKVFGMEKNVNPKSWLGNVRSILNQLGITHNELADCNNSMANFPKRKRDGMMKQLRDIS